MEKKTRIETTDNEGSRFEIVSVGTTRRDFLAGLGVGAAATLFMMGGLPACGFFEDKAHKNGGWVLGPQRPFS